MNASVWAGLCLYAVGHARSGTPMDAWDWPDGLDLWDLVGIDGQGRVVADLGPLEGLWRGGPARVTTLQDGGSRRPPVSWCRRSSMSHARRRVRLVALRPAGRLRGYATRSTALPRWRSNRPWYAHSSTSAAPRYSTSWSKIFERIATADAGG
ncbi:hypothetical protein EDD99_5468 [Streptomyces sp. 846.5]|nr:hypothetical protein [Streptomyces sp. 846.5]TDT97343.1 hypothetical protein EDD99_5468 [Streptomyces sp. 846.5]